MTDKNDNNDSVNDSVSNEEKSNKVTEKLKTMGVMPSEKEETEEKSRRFSPMLLTILIAVPVAGVIAYLSMPDQFNQLLSSVNNSSSDTATQATAGSSNVQPQFPGQPPAGSGNYTSGNYSQPLAWQPPQEPDWVKQQRAEMEKRRTDYQQKYANQYADNWTPPEPPEPPQWVKERQAEIEKQIAQYQEWSNSPANWTYQGNPQSPGYMQNPMMNQYQTNQLNRDNQPQGYQNPNQYNQGYNYNTYNQPVAPYYYYQQPYYGYGPYNPPYGWNGYGYR